MQHPPKAQKRRLPKWLLPALVMLFVAAAVALILLLPAIRAAYPVYPAPNAELPYRALTSAEPETLVSIDIAQAQGESYTLSYQDETLYLLRDGELLTIRSEYADDMLSAVCSPHVENTVTEDASEVADALSDMGLEPPMVTVTTRWADGSETVISLGEDVPETTYSYYRISTHEGVYMCSDGVAELFAMRSGQLLPVTQPALVRSLVSELTLTLKGADALTMRFATDTAGVTYGTLNAPYPYPMSADAASAMLSALMNLRLGTPEGEITAENRADWGFDDPLCVLVAHQAAGAYTTISDTGELSASDLPETTFRFTFGRLEGDFFVTCAYEGSCYLVSRFLVASFLSADADALITRTPADLGDAVIRSVYVQTGDAVYDLQISRNERVLPNNELETDEDGNLVYDVSATLNGEAISEAMAEAFLSRLSAMTVSGDAPADWSPGGAAPRWQLSIQTTGGSTRTIAAYPLDALADVLVVDGVSRHYLHYEALSIVLGELAQGV